MFFGDARFHVPVMPFLAVGAAWAAFHAARTALSSRKNPVLLTVLLLITAWVVVSSGLLAFPPFDTGAWQVASIIPVVAAWAVVFAPQWVPRLIAQPVAAPSSPAGGESASGAVEVAEGERPVAEQDAL